MKFKFFKWSVEIVWQEPEYLLEKVCDMAEFYKNPFGAQSTTEDRGSFSELSSEVQYHMEVAFNRVIGTEKKRKDRVDNKIAAIKNARAEIVRNTDYCLSLRSAKAIIEYLWTVI